MTNGSVKLMPLYLGLSCPVVARRAKSEADAGTQFAFSDSSAPEKQLPIFEVVIFFLTNFLKFVYEERVMAVSSKMCFNFGSQSESPVI
jgi:hypothetical protein